MISDEIEGGEVVLEGGVEMQLLSGGEQTENVGGGSHRQHLDEGLVVEVHEGSHDELAVHAVTHAPVSRNRVPEVLTQTATTLILMDRLSPEAKKPPKGPMMLAKSENSMKCAWRWVMVSGPSWMRPRTVEEQSGKEKGRRERVVLGQVMPSMLWRASVSCVEEGVR